MLFSIWCNSIEKLKEIIVSTVNWSMILYEKYSRYYKRFNIPDIDRVKVKLEQKRLGIAHANNTLIITVSIYYITVIILQLLQYKQIFCIIMLLLYPI